jgi:thiamine biosynthesis protein ThiS
MTIHLNGQAREVPDGLTLAALLDWLKLPGDRVAIERNLEIVPRDHWRETPLQGGDRLEVVHFVGGGSADFVVLHGSGHRQSQIRNRKS